jgi:hypothetical protein
MDKYIIWDKNKYSGKIVILEGYCLDSLKNFKEMFEVALKAIPTLKEDNTVCTKVRKSLHINGYTLLVAEFYNEEYKKIDGYEETTWNSLHIESF